MRSSHIYRKNAANFYVGENPGQLCTARSDISTLTTAKKITSEDEQFRGNWQTWPMNGPTRTIHYVRTIRRGKLSDLGQLMESMSCGGNGGGSDGSASSLDIVESGDVEEGRTTPPAKSLETVACDVGEGLSSGTAEGTASDIDVVGGVNTDEVPTAGQPVIISRNVCTKCKGLLDGEKGKSAEVTSTDFCAPKPPHASRCFPNTCTII